MTNSFPLKGLPSEAGEYFVCVKNKSDGYDWIKAYLDPSDPDPIWRKTICWSYT